ncbi:MAG: Ig-like domain-containing protein, partial [Actinomycetota bacterium]|nr:Ig-like domain-containing protein [Actinomycetota bacterium]
MIEVSGQVRAPVDYEVTDTTGDKVSATVTVTYLPVAVDDEDLGNEIGTVVTLNPLANDTGDWRVNSVRFIDPGTSDRVTELVVAGEGTWRVDASGTVSFTPQAGFEGSPTPVGYEV